MALVLNDRVKETTTSTGTGTVNLAGAETGFETFVAGVGNTNTTYYAIVHQSADEFEVGLGTVSDSSPDTLSRTTIISSSNSDSAVNFSAGTKDVFCTLPASKAVFEDASDNIALGAAPTVSNASGDLTLDVAADIVLDADGGTIVLKDGGTEKALISLDNAGYFDIYSSVQDSDIRLRGNDGGSLIDALILDMSEGGDAIFSGKIQANGALKFNSNTGTPEFQFFGSGTETGVINLASSNFNIESKVSDKDIVFKGVDGGSDVTALTLDMSDAGAAIFNNSVRVGQSSVANLFVANNSDVVEVKAGKDGTDDVDLAFYTQASGGTLAEKMRINSSGKVGIGTNSPLSELHVSDAGDCGIMLQSTNCTNDKEIFQIIAGANASSECDLVIRTRVNAGTGGTEHMRITQTGNVGIGTSSPSVALGVTGAIIASDNITAYGTPSDIRLKENIEVIDNALDKVKQLKGITYDLKSDGNRLTGLIAQDLEKVLPEAVYETSAVDDADDKHLAIRYGNTVGLLVEAIKELEARVKELEGK